MRVVKTSGKPYGKAGKLISRHVTGVGQAYIIKFDQWEARYYIDDPVVLRLYKRDIARFMAEGRKIHAEWKNHFGMEILRPVPAPAFALENFSDHLNDVIEMTPEGQLPEAVAELLTMFGR